MSEIQRGDLSWRYTFERYIDSFTLTTLSSYLYSHLYCPVLYHRRLTFIDNVSWAPASDSKLPSDNGKQRLSEWQRSWTFLRHWLPASTAKAPFGVLFFYCSSYPRI